MSRIVTILSLLHLPEDAALAEFRGEPVLAWTLRRIARCKRVEKCVVLCWADQEPAVSTIAHNEKIQVYSPSGRVPLPQMQAVEASLRWSDGWRGGLLGATCFDAGFHAPFIQDIRKFADADAVLLVDPHAALVDPSLLDQLIEYADARPEIDYCFIPGAPGMGALLLRPRLLEQFARQGGFPGRLLTYSPDLPGRDPIAREECAPVAAPLARTPHRFTFDTPSQIRLLSAATAGLNGQLPAITAADLLKRLTETAASVPPVLRDLTIELNTTRHSKPVYSPLNAVQPPERPPLELTLARAIFSGLENPRETRITFAGVGDPLLHPQFFDIVALASDAKVRGIHVETDLLNLPIETLHRLADSPVDLISVHIPGLSVSTYARLMGVDGLAQAVNNIKAFLEARSATGRGTPLIVPIYKKCRDNVHEMETWYDQWMRAVGCAVISAPTDCAGRLADVSAADMSPPRRVPCRRIQSRAMILSDGKVVTCEEDLFGDRPLGSIPAQSLSEIWNSQFASLRAEHSAGRWKSLPVCQNCREWHRP